MPLVRISSSCANIPWFTGTRKGVAVDVSPRLAHSFMRLVLLRCLRQASSAVLQIRVNTTRVAAVGSVGNRQDAPAKMVILTARQCCLDAFTHASLVTDVAEQKTSLVKLVYNALTIVPIHATHWTEMLTAQESVCLTAVQRKMQGSRMSTLTSLNVRVLRTNVPVMKKRGPKNSAAVVAKRHPRSLRTTLEWSIHSASVTRIVLQPPMRPWMNSYVWSTSIAPGVKKFVVERPTNLSDACAMPVSSSGACTLMHV
mmetsp:Transcript_53095/g.79345  ORF Transcript_53095/g.79345 Transcript_53095/m.79345 type:complete len:256 (+) Transcript_53095:391-1158(+)